MNCAGKTFLFLLINIEFIRWFHEFYLTTNLLIFQETEFVCLFLCTKNVNNIQFRGFVVTEFVKLSDEFDSSFFFYDCVVENNPYYASRIE